MRNQLRKGYYLLAGAPLVGQLVAKIAPAISAVAEKRACQGNFHARLAQLEKSVSHQRQRANLALSLIPVFCSSCPSVSVIINTCGRRDELARTLPAVLGQNYPNFEVLCVVGPEDDGTRELLAGFGEKVRVLDCPKRNISMSRNIGIREAKNTIVAFIDDDAQPAPDWLMELVQGFENGASAVGGFVHDAGGVDWQARVCVADRFGDVRHYEGIDEALAAEGPESSWAGKAFFSPTGTNMAFLREALLEIGGFDENYAWHLDETDLVLRLADAGKQISFSPGAEVTHRLAPNRARGADQIPLSFYNLAKSKTYFIQRHALPVFGPKTAEKRLKAWLAWLEAKACSAMRKGKLGKTDVERLRDELLKGRKDGEKLGQSFPRFTAPGAAA